jgi:ribose 5-phosphate isomerase RpiB
MSRDGVKAMVKAWLETPFSGAERHERRLGKIGYIEQQNFKN